MHLAGFRAEKLPKVWAGGVRRAQVCCEDYVRTPTNTLVPELQPLASVLHCLCRAKQANAKKALMAIKPLLAMAICLA